MDRYVVIGNPVARLAGDPARCSRATGDAGVLAIALAAEDCADGASVLRFRPGRERHATLQSRRAFRAPQTERAQLAGAANVPRADVVSRRTTTTARVSSPISCAIPRSTAGSACAACAGRRARRGAAGAQAPRCGSRPHARAAQDPAACFHALGSRGRRPRGDPAGFDLIGMPRRPRPRGALRCPSTCCTWRLPTTWRTAAANRVQRAGWRAPATVRMLVELAAETFAPMRKRPRRPPPCCSSCGRAR